MGANRAGALLRAFGIEFGRLVPFRRLIVGSLATYGAALAIILHTPFGDWLIRPLFLQARAPKSDAIVVLTAFSAPDGMLSDAGLRRTIEAGRLYKAQVADSIVISGRNRSELAGPTAQAMADLLVEMNVPRGALILETRSTNTHETAVNVAAIARARGWSDIVLVTDAKHMRRALASFKRQALAAAPSPSFAWDDRSEAPPYRLLKFQGAVHEWLGLLYYWWEGWI